MDSDNNKLKPSKKSKRDLSEGSQDEQDKEKRSHRKKSHADHESKKKHSSKDKHKEKNNLSSSTSEIDEKAPSPEALAEMHKYIPKSKREMSDEEKAALESFKQKIAEHERTDDHVYFRSDDYYQRWLTARKWDPEKAAEMFKTSVEWRKKLNVNELYETVPKGPYFKQISDYWPLCNDASKTVDGFVVVYEQLGKLDPKILNYIPSQELVNWHIYEMELGEHIRAKLWEKYGYTTGVVYISDVGGVGWHHIYKPALDLVGKTEVIDQDNYPETLRKLYVINMPAIFSVVWKIAKVWFDENTLAKFRFITSGYETEFRAIIPPDNLLDLYGGNLKVQLPSGGPAKLISKAKVTGGEKIEKPFKVDISRSSFYEREVEVTTPGTTLGWSFKLKSYDISFAIFSVDSDKNRKEIVAAEKVSKPTEGSCVVEAGTYILRWDNTYSWTKGKTIKYKVYLDAKELPHPSKA